MVGRVGVDKNTNTTLYARGTYRMISTIHMPAGSVVQ